MRLRRPLPVPTKIPRAGSAEPPANEPSRPPSLVNFVGVLTGTIIGMAQALGETAPLLMIGMVAFIVDIPGGFTDPATVLPVQIYLWADSPERAFVERTSAAIMVLLGFLIMMNLTAVWLRKKLERRW